MKITTFLILSVMILASLAVASGESESGAGGTENGNADQGINDEAPSVAVTRYTDLMQLFMEYPLLVANQPSRFIIHLTGCVFV